MVRGSLGARGLSITSFRCSPTDRVAQRGQLVNQPASMHADVQLQPAARFSREIDRTMETPSSSFSDRQKKSFEDRDDHFAPSNCTTNYDAFYVDPCDWNYGYCLPRKRIETRFTRTLLKSLFPWLVFFFKIFLSFYGISNKWEEKGRQNLSFFPFDGASKMLRVEKKIFSFSLNWWRESC